MLTAATALSARGKLLDAKLRWIQGGAWRGPFAV